MIVKINGKRYRGFTNLRIKLNYDGIASVFSFEGLFDTNNEFHREIFKPYGFQRVQIYTAKGELRLTGNIVKHRFGSEANPSLVSISGYSLTGVLIKSNIPPSNYPLESIDRSLIEIVEKISKAFGLNVVVDPAIREVGNQKFEKSVAEPTEKVAAYFTKLCAERNVILSHNEFGEIVLRGADVGEDIKFFFDDTDSHKMSFDSDADNMFSHIAVQRQAAIGGSGIEFVDEIINDFATGDDVSPATGILEQTSNFVGAYKPFMKILASGSEVDPAKAARSARAAQYAKISFVLKTEVTRDSRIMDLVPRDQVKCQNPEVYLFKETKLIIRSIEFDQATDGFDVTMNLTVPEAFNDQEIKPIFDI